VTGALLRENGSRQALTRLTVSNNGECIHTIATGSPLEFALGVGHRARVIVHFGDSLNQRFLGVVSMLNRPQLLFTRTKPVAWKCDVCEELFLLSSEKLTLQERAWDLERRFEDHVRSNHPSENREFTTKINSPQPGHARNETPVISRGSGIAERNAPRLQQVLSIAYEIDNLDRLRKSGSITQDEFVRLRAKLVA